MKHEDHIVVDVEIQKSIEELPNGWDDTHLMGVSVAVVYEFLSDRFNVYGPDDVEVLKKRLLRADRISGFNIWRFDFPVIFGLPNRERVEELRPKTNDILIRIWRGLGLDTEKFSGQHKGWGLDNVARGTIGQAKSGYGGDAPKWFQQGLWPKLTDYCLHDVKIERDLATFVDRHGYIVNGANLQVVELNGQQTTP